jgi:hypothetical protein
VRRERGFAAKAATEKACPAVLVAPVVAAKTTPTAAPATRKRKRATCAGPPTVKRKYVWRNGGRRDLGETAAGFLVGEKGD